MEFPETNQRTDIPRPGQRCGTPLRHTVLPCPHRLRLHVTQPSFLARGEAAPPTLGKLFCSPAKQRSLGRRSAGAHFENGSATACFGSGLNPHYLAVVAD